MDVEKNILVYLSRVESSKSWRARRGRGKAPEERAEEGAFVKGIMLNNRSLVER